MLIFYLGIYISRNSSYFAYKNQRHVFKVFYGYTLDISYASYNLSSRITIYRISRKDIISNIIMVVFLQTFNLILII